MVMSDDVWITTGSVETLAGLLELSDMLSGVVTGGGGVDVVVLMNVGPVHSQPSPSGTHEPLKGIRHCDHH